MDHLLVAGWKAHCNGQQQQRGEAEAEVESGHACAVLELSCLLCTCVCVCVCQLHLFSVDSGKSEATIDTGGKFTCSVKWVSTDCVCVACVRVSVCVRALCLCVHL